MIVRPVDIGSRIHSIRFENPGTPVPDGDGGYTETWAALRPPTAKASIETATVARLERIGFGTVSSAATHILMFPYHAGVTTKTRILFGDRVFHVLGADDLLQQHVTTVALVTEEVE